MLLALGQDPRALTQDTFNRDLYPTPGRSYEGETEDYGISAEINWDFGNVTLTSITGYREYANSQGSDTDYTTVDILYRAPTENALARDFETFTQELRLTGEAFDGKLDWLIGAYYANEELQVRDNLRFGTQYGNFVACRIAIAINPALVNPGASNCLGANVAALDGTLTGSPAFGAATPAILAGINNLASISDLGTVSEVYNQTSENFAFFTHNIFAITDTLDLTLGFVIQTKPELRRNFPQRQHGLSDKPQSARRLSGCSDFGTSGRWYHQPFLPRQFDIGLDGVSLEDRAKKEFTGTAILSGSQLRSASLRFVFMTARRAVSTSTGLHCQIRLRSIRPISRQPRCSSMKKQSMHMRSASNTRHASSGLALQASGKSSVTSS